MIKKILKTLTKKALPGMHDTHEVGSSNLPSPTKPNLVSQNNLGRLPSLEEAHRMYMNACAQRNLRKTSLVTMRQRIGAFIKWADGKTIEQITRQDVKRFAEMFPGRWSRVGHRNDVCVFLNWCGQMGFIEEGKFYKVKLMDVLQDENPIDILSVEQAEKLLNVMPDRFKARTALQLFAGIRPYESLKIQSKDLDLQGKKLYLLGEYSKLRRTRVLHDLPPNLIKWLKKYPLPDASYNAYRLARRRYFGNIAHDAMRHTFCTYAYFKMGMEMTMRYTGHSNYKTFHRHYCESSANAKDAEKYFRLIP